MTRPEIVFEDNHLLIVCKPPNMPTQSDPSGDPDLLSVMKEYLKEERQKAGEAYLGLVHRLDRPVGGLVALAKTSKAAARLSEQVRAKTMGRRYLAAVRGDAPEEGELTDWLLKYAGTNTVHVVPAERRGAKEARLAFRRLARREGMSLLLVRLYTGRSHQIRVQLSHAGYPLWGDARYGGGKPGQQIALWGAFLSLAHPTKKTRLRFTALPPAEAEPWRLFSGEIGEIAAADSAEEDTGPNIRT